MTMATTGAMSMGGAGSGNTAAQTSLNIESQFAATAQISLNDTRPRLIANITAAGTAIRLPLDFYGRAYEIITWTSPTAGSIATQNQGTTLNVTLVASSNVAGSTITYSIVSGSLPAGLTLSTGGVISGTISATATVMTYSFTVRASGSFGGAPVDRAFSIRVNMAPLTISSWQESQYFNTACTAGGTNRLSEIQAACPAGTTTCTFNPLNYGDPQGGVVKAFAAEWTCSDGTTRTYCYNSSEAGINHTLTC